MRDGRDAARNEDAMHCLACDPVHADNALATNYFRFITE
jgi:hypothetical protein